MNPKLLKERMKTKAQRPDIVVAYHNFLFQHEAEEQKTDLRDADERHDEVRRTA
jgi:hypothetical protein